METPLQQYYFLVLRPGEQGGSGSGHYSDPVIISTTEDFDQFLRTHSNCVIRLGTGVFTTKGYDGINPLNGGVIQNNVKIVGNGFSTIRLVGVEGKSGWMRVLSTPVDSVYSNDTHDCEVENLTIDCGGDVVNPITSPVGTTAIYLSGSRCKVRNVKIINACNYTSDAEQQECFVVTLTDNPFSPAIDGEITNCTYEGKLFASASRQFSIFHCSGQFSWAVNMVVSGNIVRLTESNTSAYGNAYTMGGCKNIRIQNNYLDGYLIGAYCDSGQLDGVMVNGNVFVNTQAGICFNNAGNMGFGWTKALQYWRNFVIRDNFIRLVPATNPDQWSRCGIAFGRDSKVPGVNNRTESIHIIGNRIMAAVDDLSVIKTIYNYGVITNTRGPYIRPLPTISLKAESNFIEPKFKNSIV